MLAVLGLCLVLSLWGCPSIREQQLAKEQCAASGGVMIDNTCHQPPQDAPGDWSERLLKEMRQGFERRQPGGGRLR